MYPKWNKAHKLKAEPYRFARLLAKIALGYAVAEYGLDGFVPLVRDIILGKSDDCFNFVGGSWGICGEPINTDTSFGMYFTFVSPTVARLVVEIRLFSAAKTPDYHVVVGMISTQNSEHVSAMEKNRLQGKIPDAPGALG
jgi:hypothetical protein